MNIPKFCLEIFSDSAVSDFLVNGESSVYVVRSNQLISIPNPFRSDSELVSFAKDWIEYGGDHLDFANPICDVSIQAHQIAELASLGISSLRIHAALSQGIGNQNLVSIRVHRSALVALESFGDSESLTRVASEGSIVISGTAGAGKTTLLRSMLAVRPDLRTVVIEDSPELLPIPGHFVGLHSRRPNSEGAGEITLQRLLVESLRMRPQRIVLGEVRSYEIVTALQALNLGAAQVAFTIHANTAADVKPRLFALWLAAQGLAADFEMLLASGNLSVVHLVGQKVAQIARLS